MLAFAFMLTSSACTTSLDLPATAQIVCGDDDECPGGSLCVEEIARCVDVDSPCVTETGEVSGDGTECGDGLRCVGGNCREPFCGDALQDAGEECDEANSATCRDDCTRAVCGDGLVDRNEGCDSARDDCVACAQICLEGFGDCDRDATNGCECNVSTLGTFAQSNILRGVVAQGAAYVVVAPFDADDVDLVRIPLDEPSAAETVLTGFNEIYVAADGDVLWVTGSPLGSVFDSVNGPVVGGEASDVLRVPGFGIAVRGAFAYVNHFTDGIWKHDAVSGQTVGRVPTDVCATACDLMACGDDGLLVGDRDTDVTSLVHIPSGNAIPLFDASDNVVNMGCNAAGQPMWREGRALIVEAPAQALANSSGAAGRRVVANVPASDDGIFDIVPIVFVDDAPVLSLAIATTVTSALATPFGGLQSLGRGKVIGLADGELVLADGFGTARVTRMPLDGIVDEGGAP